MIWVVSGALALDLIIGDPQRLPHPVRAIGMLINLLDKMLYSPAASKTVKRILGALIVTAVVGSTYLLTWAVIKAFGMIWAPLEILASIVIVATALAVKSLRDHSVAIVQAIDKGDLAKARERTSMIVGRDTRSLGGAELLRAAAESVAENSVDGVIAPMFYALIGGAPLAMAFKAVNTLDSMMGYKNDRYSDFGWAAAKLDDAANYIPARLSPFVIAIAACMLGLDARAALKAAVRDRDKHPSPNSGLPEAAFAGALGVRLGGINHYDGEDKKIGFFGDDVKPLTGESIMAANQLVLTATLIFATIGVFLWYLGGQNINKL